MTGKKKSSGGRAAAEFMAELEADPGRPPVTWTT